MIIKGALVYQITKPRLALWESKVGNRMGSDCNTCGLRIKVGDWVNVKGSRTLSRIRHLRCAVKVGLLTTLDDSGSKPELASSQ